MAQEKVQKLTEEEIQSLTNLQDSYNRLVTNIGNTESQIWVLNERKENLKSELKSLQEQETKLAQELEDKYGTGTISLEKGEFSPSN